jgi:hypothetical protein
MREIRALLVGRYELPDDQYELTPSDNSTGSSTKTHNASATISTTQLPTVLATAATQVAEVKKSTKFFCIDYRFTLGTVQI